MIYIVVCVGARTRVCILVCDKYLAKCVQEIATCWMWLCAQIVVGSSVSVSVSVCDVSCTECVQKSATCWLCCQIVKYCLCQRAVVGAMPILFYALFAKSGFAAALIFWWCLSTPWWYPEMSCPDAFTLMSWCPCLDVVTWFSTLVSLSSPDALPWLPALTPCPDSLPWFLALMLCPGAFATMLCPDFQP